MLERLSDVRGTIEGKIVAVVLAILLVLPMASISAFANKGDSSEEPQAPVETTETVEAPTDEPDPSQTTVLNTTVVEEPTTLPATGDSTYATIDEFFEAVEVVSEANEVFDGNDATMLLEAIDKAILVYDDLSDVDKADPDVNGTYEGLKEFAAQLRSGDFNENIETMASYTGKVTLYGTPSQAIKSGPLYGSKVTINLGTRTGQSWNNVSYTIPQVSEYFVLNDGWAIDYVSVAGNSSGNRQPGASFLLSMSGGSMVYYFKQVSKTFTLSYNANGGIDAPASQSGTGQYGVTLSVSSTTPTRTGYTFEGWNTNSSGTGTTYRAGGSIYISSNTTLYAMWKKVETPKVTLTYMDRSSQYAQDTYDKGATATVKNCSNSLNGYTFKGWDTNSAACTAVYAKDDTFTINANTTLYAVWEKNVSERTYTVTYTDGVNGVTVFDDQSYEGLKAGDDTPAFEMARYGTVADENGKVTPDRKGYTFLGWAPTVNPVVSEDDADENSEIIYTATWQKKAKVTVTVEFVDENGDIVGTETVEVDKDSGYDVTDETKKIPEGYVSNGNPTGDLITGTADSNKTVTVPVKTEQGDPESVTITVTWVDENGAPELYKITGVDPNAIPEANAYSESYGMTNPTKAADENYTYKFDRWERIDEEGGNVTYMATYTRTPIVPPEPTPSNLTELKLAVWIVCDPGTHDGNTYYLTKYNDGMTIGEVVANDDENSNAEYPYKSTVTISSDAQDNIWLAKNMANGTQWNVLHKLAPKSKDLTATLYWDGSKWTLPTDPGMNPDVTAGMLNYMTIHTVHIPVTITVEFVDENGDIVGTETVEVDKDSGYDVTDETKKIPEGYVSNGNPTGDLITGTADSNKTVTVPVKTEGGDEPGPGPDEPNLYTITVKYVDEEGNPIEGYGEVTESAAEDGAYNVTDKKVEIDGYTFVEVENGIDLEGTVDSNLTITLIYKKNGEEAPGNEPTPAPGGEEPIPTPTPSDDPITVVTVPVIPVVPIPALALPAPLQGFVDAAVDFLQTPVLPLAGDIADDETPLADIEDEETPMSAFDHPFCWVHYYIILGIIITAIYGGGVIARRLGYNHKIKKYEDDVTGKEKKKGLETEPADNKAQVTI